MGVGEWSWSVMAVGPFGTEGIGLSVLPLLHGPGCEASAG